MRGEGAFEGFTRHDVIMMRDGDRGRGESALLGRFAENREGLVEYFVLAIEGCDEWWGEGQCDSLGKNPVRVIAEWGHGVKARKSKQS